MLMPFFGAASRWPERENMGAGFATTELKDCGRGRRAISIRVNSYCLLSPERAVPGTAHRLRFVCRYVIVYVFISGLHINYIIVPVCL